MCWLPWARPGHDRNETRRYLRGARQLRAERRAFEFVIEDAKQGELLGMMSLHRIDWARRTAGLGYWLRRSRRGEGNVTEAGQALIEHAFRDLRLHRLELHVAPENHVSHRVAAKLGFRHEGLARDSEWINSRYRDHVQYSLLDSDVLGSGERTE